MADSNEATGARLFSACPVPRRCPYCHPEAARHWIGWGSYARYAGDPEDPNRRIAVARYRCRVTKRTFSLLPDDLLPYCALRTEPVLEALTALVVAGQPLAPLARRIGVGRSLLRSLRGRFLNTVPRLRLPTRAGPMTAAAWLEALAPEAGRRGQSASVELFRGWKEGEPKRSIAGIYAR